MQALKIFRNFEVVAKQPNRAVSFSKFSTLKNSSSIAFASKQTPTFAFLNNFNFVRSYAYRSENREDRGERYGRGERSRDRVGRFGRDRRDTDQINIRPSDAAYTNGTRVLLRSATLTTEEAVKDFFQGLPVTKIEFAKHENLPRSFISVEFETPEAMLEAIRVSRSVPTSDNEKIGIRTLSEQVWEDIKRESTQPFSTVQLIRIPYNISEQELRQFFDPLPIADLRLLPGRAIVKFETADAALQALTKNNTTIGRNQIGIMGILENEYNAIRVAPITRVRMSSLPFTTTEQQVREFFSDCEIRRLTVINKNDPEKGEIAWRVHIEFMSEADQERAMEKNGLEFFGRQAIIRPSSAVDRITDLKKARSFSTDSLTDKPRRTGFDRKNRNDRKPEQQQDQSEELI